MKGNAAFAPSRSFEGCGMRSNARHVPARSKRRVSLIALLAAHMLLGSPAASQAPTSLHRAPASSPDFTGYVVDQANLLDAQQRGDLTDRLGHFQRNTSHQLVVVTVRTLGGQDIAAFTTALASRWGVGRKGSNDGIVLLIAPNERKARIAVGRGLEQRLTNAFCRAVMAKEMVPAFKVRHFAKGINAGVTAIIDKLAATER